MTARPEFSILDAANQTLLRARGTADVPEGKGGHVFIDGVLHRILDIEAPIVGDAAFALRVNEKELTHLGDMLDVSALDFYELRTTTIASLAQLGRLKHLKLQWVQKLADLSPLAGMSLLTLQLDDVRNANDIAPLAMLTNLQALTISGGMNSDQKIDTLTPLRELSSLSELRLVAIKLGDQDLLPLTECSGLHDLHLPNTFDTAQYAEFLAKRPDMRCLSLAAYQSLDHAISGKGIMVTGRRKPFLNAKTDAARLTKYQSAFDALVTKYQAET